MRLKGYHSYDVCDDYYKHKQSTQFFTVKFRNELQLNYTAFKSVATVTKSDCSRVEPSYSQNNLLHIRLVSYFINLFMFCRSVCC